MKSLYEFTTTWTGESYVRVYVWADSEGEAMKLAFVAFREENPKYVEGGLTSHKLFSADAESFATKPSDSGFEID